MSRTIQPTGPRPSSWYVEYGGSTRQGKHRSCNQDYLAYGKSGLSFCLCDGMSGHSYGEFAARVAGNVATDAWERGLSIRSALEETSDAVLAVERWMHAPQMGTTVLMAAVEGDELHVAWIGDTMAILVREGQIECLTPPDRTATGSSRLAKCLGAGCECEARERSLLIDKEDVVILCTDGVWSHVDEPMLSSIVASSDKPAPMIAYELVYDIARDSLDDASAIVLRFHPCVERQAEDSS